MRAICSYGGGGAWARGERGLGKVGVRALCFRHMETAPTQVSKSHGKLFPPPERRGDGGGEGGGGVGGERRTGRGERLHTLSVFLDFYYAARYLRGGRGHVTAASACSRRSAPTRMCSLTRMCLPECVLLLQCALLLNCVLFCVLETERQVRADLLDDNLHSLDKTIECVLLLECVLFCGLAWTYYDYLHS